MLSPSLLFFAQFVLLLFRGLQRINTVQYPKQGLHHGKNEPDQAFWRAENAENKRQSVIWTG